MTEIWVDAAMAAGYFRAAMCLEGVANFPDIAVDWLWHVVGKYPDGPLLDFGGSNDKPNSRSLPPSQAIPLAGKYAIVDSRYFA